MVSSRTRFAWWWRRSGAALRAFIFFVGVALFALLMYWQRPTQESEHFGNNVLVFVIVNLNIVVLGVLAFLVGRNVIKLVFDRHRRILGSKLRSRLVVAFVTVALVPTAILFFVASGLLSRAVEDWFSSQIEDTVDGAVQIARQYYSLLERETQRSTSDLASEIATLAKSEKSVEALGSFLESRRQARGLFSASVLSGPESVVASATHAAAAITDFREPAIDLGAVSRAIEGLGSSVPAERESSRFYRVYQPITWAEKPAVLIVSVRAEAQLAQAMQQVTDSYREYEQLKTFKSPLKTGYLLSLAMVTMMILFAAIWFAFYISRELTGPIQRLAEGTREVARGNYDFQIRASGDDEVSLLIRSFNTMTSDLRQSRREAENRRVFIEIILANLAVGVIGIDRSGSVTAVNDAGRGLFELGERQEFRGSTLRDVVGERVFDQVSGLLEKARTGDTEQVIEREVSVLRQGREHRLLCTAGTIVDGVGKQLGQVLIFDDITDLVKAQNIAAWREVARRIAHEIKNPLTPIQLSAQRLQKLFSGTAHDPVVAESTQTIVEHVDSIKRLANEFSNFARMPTAELAPGDLNAVIADALAPFAETYSDITFQLIAANDLPRVEIDREQIRRVVINLLDNAIQAVRSTSSSGRVVISTDFDRPQNQIRFEVADSGPGIPAEIKSRVFDPYFTTKKSGTGLGLAIVTSIVAEHHGSIRVLDNQPRGTKFVVELPVSPQQGTVRKFAGR